MRTHSPLRVGLLGVGHLGSIHLKLLGELSSVALVGFYDADDERARRIAAETGVPAFDSAEALVDAADALDIVTPTMSHAASARLAIAAGKPFFVEKPLAATPEEARELVEGAERAGLVAQVGHIERFNPGFMAAEAFGLQPQFIEGHRLAPYNPRGTDVSVVHDLMIHDLDVILSIVKAEVTEVRASGVAVVSNSPDIANARIEFADGCVANLTASRISLKAMRRLRMFQANAYVAVDFLEKQAEIVRLSDEPDPAGMSLPVGTGDQQRFLRYEHPPAEPVNALKLELQEFVEAVRGERAVRVGLADGYRALKTAQMIAERVRR